MEAEGRGVGRWRLLGGEGASGEIIVGDKNGVWKTRSVQRSR